jgi:predicted SnoaL-like aldol condensation-catalyzing enzyme
MKLNKFARQATLATVCVLAPLASALAGSGDPRVEARNKNQVQQLSAAMLGKAPVESLRHYFAPNLVQHDPAINNGADATLSWINGLRRLAPARTLTVKHILADGDFVFVHAQLSDTPSSEMTGQNRYDIYRLAFGMIIEHWAYAGDAPTRSASGNSEFNDAYKYPGAAPVLSPERVQLHRELVQTLSEEVFSKRNFGVVERLWAPGYLQHNPWLPNGRAALQEALPYIVPTGNLYRVVHAVADGDLAMVCAQAQDPGSNPKDEFNGAAVCDMYRVANLELVEHWDVSQAVPSTSANGHSMFSHVYRGHNSDR